MLVLSRNKGESLLIGENIEIIIADINPRTVRLAIQAPREIRIIRKELRDGKGNQDGKP